MGNRLSNEDDDGFVLINPPRQNGTSNSSSLKNHHKSNPPPQKKIHTSENDICGFSFNYNHHCTFMKDTECCVCLCEYDNNDVVHMLPCNHIFHRRCIVTWFQKQPRCPLCLDSNIPL